MEVDFVTLGDASERLDVPSPTLRNWTDQLEEFNLHFVMRNNRNERIYYDTDIEIFQYIKGLKQEYGRKTTMKDIVNMLRNMEDRFIFRSEEDAPVPEPSNKTAGELLSPDEVQRLMENSRVRALIGYMVAETTTKVREDLQEEFAEQSKLMQIESLQSREQLIQILREEVRSELTAEHEKVQEELKKFQEEQSKRDEEQREFINKRDVESMTAIKELLELKKQENEKSKGFFAKLFGG